MSSPFHHSLLTRQDHAASLTRIQKWMGDTKANKQPIPGIYREVNLI